jgi:hypothetical protein
MKKRLKQRKSATHEEPSPSKPDPAVPEGPIPASGTQSLSVVVANVFTRLRLVERVRLLQVLLRPVGPMALAVLGGGAFAKYVAYARWPHLSVSLDDAARVTFSQVHELVRYLEQSNPVALQQVLAVFMRDTTTVAALGGSVAVMVMRQITSAKRPASPGRPSNSNARHREKSAG